MGGHKGQSDHCPIGIDLNWTRPNLSKVVPIESSHSGHQGPSVLMTQVTTQRPGAPETCIQFIGRPVIKVQVGGYFIYVLLDSGSQFTIINPPEGYTALDDPVFGKYAAKQAPYLKRLTLSGIGGAAITTNRNVTFPISINGVQVPITALILPKHCPFMPRVIIGLNDLIHKLGGVGFLPICDAYGDQSRVTVRFPKLGTSVQSEPFLKHPDELAPAELDMDQRS